jgi:alpha-1,6-mannosyltransferase
VKIADVSEFYSPTGGGVRNYVDHKFKAAARLGHFLTVIAPGTEDRVELRDGGKLIWLRTPQLPFDANYRMFWSARDVFRILDEEAPDLVEGSSPWRGGWIVGKWPGNVTKMLFMHADPVAVYPQTLLAGALSPRAIDRLFGWFWAYLRRLNSHFDGCVVAGAWLADRFASHGLAQLNVVPFGVDRESFGPAHRDGNLRTLLLEQCGLGPEAALLINVGRHHPEKRVGMLIDAVTLAQASRPIGLVIVGDGLIHGQVRAKAERAQHIHLAGRIEERVVLAAMLASADALLHGSTAETYGFVVAEALCSGTPVVVPDAGGAGDLAARDCSEVYRAGDRRAAADAILRLLKRDRELLSRAAIESGERKIGDIDTHFDKLFELYAMAVKRKQAASHADELKDDVAYETV